MKSVELESLGGDDPYRSISLHSFFMLLNFPVSQLGIKLVLGGRFGPSDAIVGSVMVTE